MTLHGLLEGCGVVAVEQAHAATAVNAVGVVDAHHEAHVAVAVVTPLLLGVKLAGRVGDFVAAVVGHERYGATGLPSLRIAERNFSAVDGTGGNTCDVRCRDGSARRL